MFYVYILKSSKDGGLYIGRTNNTKRRFKEHEQGKVSSTKSRRPLVLVKTFEINTMEESVRLEKEWKKGYKREELRKNFSN